MSWEAIAANWPQLKDVVQDAWENLSDEAFEQIAGRRTELIGRIQEAYGLSTAEAERQIHAFEEAYENQIGDPSQHS